MSKYNRAKAISYAKSHWDTVCDDGCVAVKSDAKVKRSRPIVTGIPKGTKFQSPGQSDEFIVGPKGNIGRGDSIGNLDDCTHFVSSSIGTAGGGGLPVGAWDCFPAYGVLG